MALYSSSGIQLDTLLKQFLRIQNKSAARDIQTKETQSRFLSTGIQNESVDFQHCEFNI
jgi:hypothetical protein